ncbi:MAG TPA: SAF domain-containing protein [Acidimicrobiales bacterium]|nr:SAF domain-containing protein [Acidimicrobiales bacterium]
MTSTISRDTTSEIPMSLAGIRLRPKNKRRRPLLAIASLALIACCVAVFTSLYMKAGRQVSVLLVERDISAGAPISQGDIGAMKVSMAQGTQFIPVSDADGVIGRRAAVPLLSGSIIVQGDLATDYAPPSGSALVGVAVKPGQLPADGVYLGDTVDVVLTGAPGAPINGISSSFGTESTSSASSTSSNIDQPLENSTPGSILAADASVIDVASAPESADSDMVLVSILVPSTIAPLVSTASAANQAAIVVVAPGS